MLPTHNSEDDQEAQLTALKCWVNFFNINSASILVAETLTSSQSLNDPYSRLHHLQVTNNSFSYYIIHFPTFLQLHLQNQLRLIICGFNLLLEQPVTDFQKEHL